ncbi:MAG: conjugative transposon protein TraK [Flavobacteriaceae bacterium]|nr:conjugative transposon protein TraK [Flavobacteriaceae bacterium]MCY4216592.1 conjugative transposon protein TraK [Flavobacteriaceae bacterium]MCY4253499.1 conjugative transposon protein TraK [Flavobacteriaceae bacterium]
MILKSVEQKIKLALIVSIGSLAISGIIVITVTILSLGAVNSERNSVYVLDHGIPFIVERVNTNINREAEYKGHVNLFHQLFFTIPPDDAFIKKNMEYAMYLIDESGILEYNNLREKGFYNSLLGSSATATITTDSIEIDTDNQRFTYYGTQRIERETSILRRLLVTEGKVIDAIRSEHNPHGVLISDWVTVKNTDLEYERKRGY